MSKHTEGPWFVRQSEYNEGQWYIELSEGTGCRGNEYMSVGGICTEADARLLGASPELLDALKGMLDIWRSTCNAIGWRPEHLVQYDKAQIAIAKAIGDAP